MLGVPGATAYMGCVGDDDFAKIMADAATADGVDVRYMVDAATPSGTCAVAVKGGERSLVANLAAANNYKIAHVKESANWALVDAARVVYSAGFFLTVAPDAMLEVAQACTAAGKTYCLNLSAPFLAQVPPFKKAMMDVMPHVSVLFGNETEARAFAESEGWATQDTQEIAAKIAALPKASGTRGRTVVITQGADATVVYENGRTHLVPVIPLAADKLVDTNGAGDAFVGGFLTGLAGGATLSDALDSRDRSGGAAHFHTGRPAGLMFRFCSCAPRPTRLGSARIFGGGYGAQDIELCLPELRGGFEPLAGPLRFLRRMELDCRGIDGFGRRRGSEGGSRRVASHRARAA